MYLSQYVAPIKIAVIGGKRATVWTWKQVRPQLANIVTFGRIILSVWIAKKLWIDNSNDPLVLLAIIIAASSDGLDGLIARGLEIVSNIGKILDKSADKILIVPVLTFACWCYVRLWFSDPFIRPVSICLGFISLLDFILFFGGIVLGIMKIRIEASQDGKAKMRNECYLASFWGLIYFLQPFGWKIYDPIPLAIITLIFAPRTAYFSMRSFEGYVRDTMKAIQAYQEGKDFRIE